VWGSVQFTSCFCGTFACNDFTSYFVTSASYLPHAEFLLGLFFDPEDGANMFLRNVCWISTVCTMLYPRTLYGNTSHIGLLHNLLLLPLFVDQFTLKPFLRPKSVYTLASHLNFYGNSGEIHLFFASLATFCESPYIAPCFHVRCLWRARFADNLFKFNFILGQSRNRNALRDLIHDTSRIPKAQLTMLKATSAFLYVSPGVTRASSHGVNG
jgi:hypothetical protein